MLSARWPMAAGERVDRSLPLLGAGRPGFVAGVLWHSPDVALDSGKLGLVLFKEANQPKLEAVHLSAAKDLFLL